VSRRDKPQKDQREKKISKRINPTPLITPALERKNIPQQRHHYRYGNQTC